MPDNICPATGKTQTGFEHFMDALTESSFPGAIYGANAQLASTPQQAAAWSALANVSNAEFNRQTQIEAAREGRTTVIQNNNIQREQEIERQRRLAASGEKLDSLAAALENKKIIRKNGGKTSYSLAFTEYKDYDGDGRISPGELRGAREFLSVSSEEKIYFATLVEDPRDTPVEFSIYNANGDLVAKSSRDTQGENDILITAYRAKDLKDSGKATVNSKVEWKANGKIIDSYKVNFFNMPYDE